MKRSWRHFCLLVAAFLLLPTVTNAAWRGEGPFVAVISDVAVDTSEPDTIYAATSGGGVWRSDDGGQTRTPLGEGLANTDVRALAVAGGSPARLYAGLAGGSVWSTELP